MRNARIRPYTATLLAWLLVVSSVEAGPLDFGKAELAAALRERNLGAHDLGVTIRAGESESYSLQPEGVVAADERGAMYAFLDAAEQVRTKGRIRPASGRPATPMRGIRFFLHSEELEQGWYFSREHWDSYFAMLARNRLNRFNLVFAHQTNYLAPPYPYLVALGEFPQIRVPGLSDVQRERNLQTLCYVARSAADHGVDFALGVWQQNAQVNQVPTVEGISSENVGPYSGAALAAVLRACPEIRSVQVRTNDESGIPTAGQVPFYRDHLFPAIKAAGRTLDLRTWRQSAAMMDAAKQVNVPTRISTKYWAEHLGRPYLPPETWEFYGYQALLSKPRAHPLFWELWGLGSHRILLWGNPDYVRRIASTVTMSGTLGFEVDAPPAQKGFGNRPGRWDVFTDAHSARKFWNWDFERYWLFYMLWGRLSYDPATPDTVWMQELQRRFGDAAADVLEAYRQSSRVLNEIVTVHLADPNMYIWPEINPGGLIDSYKEILPSDWSYIASIPEADITDPMNARLTNVMTKVFPERAYGSSFIADTSKIIVDWLEKRYTVGLDEIDPQTGGIRGCPNCMMAMPQTNGSAAAAPTVGVAGSMARFTIINNYLYAVNRSSLNIIDISNTTTPVKAAVYPAGWNIETIYPFRQKLFLGASAGMFIINISNPVAPVREGVFQHARACDPVVADDNFAFVTLRAGTFCQGTNNQLDVINVQNVMAPTLAKTYAMTNPFGLAKDGNLLFICDGKDGLKVYNASNVPDLQLINHISGLETYDVIAGNKKLILVTQKGLYQYDYTDINNMRQLSKIAVNR